MFFYGNDAGDHIGMRIASCCKPMRAMLMLAITGLTGCATVAEGNIAKPIDLGGHYLPSTTTGSGLVVHGRELTELSSPNFGVLEFTFENATDHWIRLDDVRLDFGDPVKNQGVTVPGGADMQAWQAATMKRNAVRSENAQTALAVIALGGAVAAGGSHSGKVRAVATGAAVGAALATSAAATNAAVAESLYPQDHLFAVPIAIPPRLFAQRWIALNTSAEINKTCLTWTILDYDTSEHQRERLVLTFRDRPTGSEWQSAACVAQLSGPMGAPTH
jgi:hypothetical protein